MSLELKDFIGYLNGKGIFIEYEEYLKHRFGDNITIEMIWNDFNHEDILNATVTWAEMDSPGKWGDYHRDWNYHCTNNIKPVLARCRSIW